MIVKGIIKSIDFGSNTCMVRIPTWEPVGNPETVIPAVFSVTPGTFNSYKENDVVWVAFENNIASHPVIIGKLYTGTNADKTEPRGVVNCQSLTVSDSAVLPASTKITQATSDILDERNGLKVQTLEELITAVAANAASVSNLVIWEENPTLGRIEYSYAFSASEESVAGNQPTDADWDKLEVIAETKGKAELVKDDFTAAEFEGLTISKAAKLWLTAGGAWKAGTTDPNDSTKIVRNWVPQTGYIPEANWIASYAEKNSYPLLCVFKHTKYVYYKQGMDEVRTTEELIRSPRVSYPTEYSLKMTADTHAGVNQTENLYITAVKRFAGSLEEEDKSAFLWYWNPDNNEWTTPGTEDPKYILNFEKDDFIGIIKDRDLVVIATHAEAFNPNNITEDREVNGSIVTCIPDPLKLNANLSTWLQLVADANVYEIETIPYSPLNTAVINLDNDSAALPYDEDGNKVLYKTTVSTTASVYLNGEDISKDFTYTWYYCYYNSEGQLVNEPINDDGEQEQDKFAVISNEGRTIAVSAAYMYVVLATKKKTASPSYSVPSGGLAKTFTVAKQLQGEAMMSSVITSSAGTSFNTKNLSEVTSTTLTAYLYRGTEEYKPKDLYYEWYTLSSVPEKEGEEPTGQLIPSAEYESLDGKKQKSIKINNIATLRNKSVYFIAYTEDPSVDGNTGAILSVARLGITTLGKN